LKFYTHWESQQRVGIARFPSAISINLFLWLGIKLIAKKSSKFPKKRWCSYSTPGPFAFALRRRINGGGLQAKQAPDVGIHEKEMGPSSVFWAEETRNRAPVLELPVVSYAVGAAGFWRPKKQVPKIVILVF